MRIGKVPSGPLRMLVRERTQTYTLYRPDGDTSGYGETGTALSGAEYSETTADLDLFAPQNEPEQYPTGVQSNASLQGLCLPGTDVQEGDVLAYGSTHFEVKTAEEWPDQSNAQVTKLSLDERSDVTP